MINLKHDTLSFTLPEVARQCVRMMRMLDDLHGHEETRIRAMRHARPSRRLSFRAAFLLAPRLADKLFHFTTTETTHSATLDGKRYRARWRAMLTMKIVR